MYRLDTEMERTAQKIPEDRLNHMIGVAEYMFDRAHDYGVPRDEAYVVGLMHDIGYLYGPEKHDNRGAELLQWVFGLNSISHDVIAYHGGRLSEHEPELYPGKSDEPHFGWFEGCDRYDRLRVLLCEADMSVDLSGERVGFEARMDDIRARHGNEPDVVSTCADNIEYVKRYCADHGIPQPDGRKGES